MNYSSFQKDIFDFAENNQGNALISACAGSGKTTTLVEMMNRIKGKGIFLAFNKSIAQELSTRIPSHCEASTLHSLGLKVLKHSFGYKIKVEFQKTRYLIDSLKDYDLTFIQGNSRHNQLVFSNRFALEQLVNIAKATLVDYTDRDKLVEVADNFGIDFEENHLSKVCVLMEKGKAMTNTIDFNDMLYLPVVYSLPCPKYDFIFVDESQDLNMCQIELIKNLGNSQEGTRIFCVGDKRQSIYGFRGADSKAMNRIQEGINATELPLSVCYRCPSSHIDLVKSIEPSILVSDHANEGSIETIKQEKLVEYAKDNDLVLCRTNAPLVGAAMKFLSLGKKAVVIGQDIGKNLISIIKKSKASSLIDLVDSIKSWESNEIEILMKRIAPESKISLVMDKAEAILSISERCSSLDQVINTIDIIFKDERSSGVTFSTVHRAKGLESNNVFILRPELIPLKRKNQKDWEIEQESNIQYVALTRSKDKLFFVEKD